MPLLQCKPNCHTIVIQLDLKYGLTGAETQEQESNRKVFLFPYFFFGLKRLMEKHLIPFLLYCNICNRFPSNKDHILTEFTKNAKCINTYFHYANITS